MLSLGADGSKVQGATSGYDLWNVSLSTAQHVGPGLQWGEIQGDGVERWSFGRWAFDIHFGEGQAVEDRPCEELAWIRTGDV